MKKAFYYLIVYLAFQVAAFIFPGAVIIGGIMVSTGCDFRPAVEQSLVWILLVEYLSVSWFFLKKKWAFLNWGRILHQERLLVVFISVILIIALWFLIDCAMAPFLKEDVNTLETDSFPTYVIVAECVLTLIIPFAEELLFRGAMLRAIYVRHHNIVLAIIVSAAIFGIAHWNLYQGIGAFFAGIILGWMYYQTGSIIPGIIIHTLNNIISSAWHFTFGFNTSVADIFPNSTLYVLFLIVMALVFFRCCFFFYDRYKDSEKVLDFS